MTSASGPLGDPLQKKVAHTPVGVDVDVELREGDCVTPPAELRLHISLTHR